MLHHPAHHHEPRPRPLSFSSLPPVLPRHRARCALLIPPLPGTCVACAAPLGCRDPVPGPFELVSASEASTLSITRAARQLPLLGRVR